MVSDSTQLRIDELKIRLPVGATVAKVYKTAQRIGPSIRWSPSGRYIAFNTPDNADVHLLDTSSFRQRPPLTCFGSSNSHIAWSPDEEILAVGGSFDDCSIALWSVQNQKLIRLFGDGHDQGVYALAWFGSMIVSSSDDALLRCWDPCSGTLLGTAEDAVISSEDDGRSSIGALEPSPNGRLLASTGYHHQIALRTSTEFENPDVIPILRDGAAELAWSSDSKRIAVSGFDSVVRIYDVATRKRTEMLDTPHKEYTGSLNFSCDDSILAVNSGYTNERAILMHVGTGDVIPMDLKARTLAFSPRDPKIAVAIDRICLILDLDLQLMGCVADGCDEEGQTVNVAALLGIDAPTVAEAPLSLPLSKNVVRPRPKLNDTDRRIIECIKNDPGQAGKQIAEVVSVTPEHFRRIYSQKLKHYGFTNSGNGDGYFPPGGP